MKNIDSKHVHMLFLVSALQLYQEGQFPAPDPTVTLCFGEELHDLNNAKSKLVIVQVRPIKSLHVSRSNS